MSPHLKQCLSVPVCLSLAVMGRETGRFVEVTSRSSESPEHQLTLTVLRKANLCFHGNSLFCPDASGLIYGQILTDGH